MANLFRQKKRKSKPKHDKKQECPYCKSRNIELCNRDWLCRNCHRHFIL